MRVERLKRLIAIGMILSGCLDLSLAQGIQGNVKLTGKATVIATGHAITLSWKASQGAASYCVYRGTTEGGSYTKIASGIVGTSYTDIQVGHKQTLYYVTSAVNAGGESGYSNETVAVIP
jgi:fibronectin type 3 domain-containing protein